MCLLKNINSIVGNFLLISIILHICTIRKIEATIGFAKTEEKSEIINDLIRLGTITFGSYVCNFQSAVGIIGKSYDLSSLKVDQFDYPIARLSDKDNKLVTSLETQDLRFLKVKLVGYIVIADSTNSLKDLLDLLEDSIWWNTEGKYIFIDSSTDLHGCKLAHAFLRVSWTSDILHALFVCTDPKIGTQFFTYNPYSKDAPEVWSVFGQFTGRTGHPWTMFNTTIEELTNRMAEMFNMSTSDEKCRELFFRKTTTLDGYPIKVNVVQICPTMIIQPNVTGVEKYSGLDGQIMRTIFQKLKARLIEKVYNEDRHVLGHIYENGTSYGMIKDVSKGLFDMGLNSRFSFITSKVTFTFRHLNGGFCALIKTPERVTTFAKIIHFLSPSVFFVLFLSCVFTIFCLSLTGVQLGDSFMDLLRMILGTSMLNHPTALSVRIVLSTIIFLFLVTNAIFQGRWLFFLTQSQFVYKIKWVDDLNRYDYFIYGDPAYVELIPDPVLQSRYRAMEYKDCIKQVVDDEQMACFDACTSARVYFDEKRFVTRKIWERSLGFPVRPKWPLTSTINFCIQRLVESGLVTFWERFDEASYMAKIQRLRISQQENKTLIMMDLLIAWYVLAVGYFLSAVCFFLECHYYEHRFVRKFLTSVETPEFVKRHFSFLRTKR